MKDPTLQAQSLNSKLPLEIFSRVVDHIDDRKTLLSMLLSSKFVYHEVERKLYRSMESSNPMVHIQFLKCILDTRRAYLPRLVRRYSLVNVASHFIDMLARALPLFVNLKHLLIAGYAGTNLRALPTESLCPFQLHTFRCDSGAVTSLEVAPFLDSQHSLEVLRLVSIPDNFSVARTSLQKLNHISGPIELILQILPNRENISNIHWEPLLPRLPVHVSLLPSFAHVRIFSFGMIGKRPPLQSIIPLLRHVEILEFHRINVSHSHT